MTPQAVRNVKSFLDELNLSEADGQVVLRAVDEMSDLLANYGHLHQMTPIQFQSALAVVTKCAVEADHDHAH